MIRDKSDVRRAILTEMRKLYDPDEVGLSNLTTFFGTKSVTVDCMVLVKDQKKEFHATIDIDSEEVAGSSLDEYERLEFGFLCFDDPH